MIQRVFMGLVLAGAMIVAGGCRSAVYSAYEKVGVYKRDLLKKRVIAARDEEKEAGEQFKDALTKVRELYGNQNTPLEKTYDQLKSEFDDSNSRAEAGRKGV